jgi:hypothetical protein
MHADGLSPEVNTIDDFISEAKRHETVKKMQDYYDKDTPSRMVNTMKNSVSQNDTNEPHTEPLEQHPFRSKRT